MRKIFTVIIHKKEFDVYSINGKEHEGLNDMPKEWWLYFSDRLPDGTFPPIDSPHWEPFNASILRQCWEIKIKQSNTTKEKWGETQFKNSIWVEMWCNGKLVYEFSTSGKHLDYAMAKVQVLQVQMSEHPYNFFNPQEENGRLICWYGLPAKVKVKSNTWEIGIIPDYESGLTKEEWWKEYKRRRSNYTAPDTEADEMEAEDLQEDEQDDFINWGDALSDQNIYWFRKIDEKTV